MKILAKVKNFLRLKYILQNDNYQILTLWIGLLVAATLLLLCHYFLTFSPPHLNIKLLSKQFLEGASLSGVENQEEVKQRLTMQEEIHLLQRFLRLIESRNDLYTSYLSLPSLKGD